MSSMENRYCIENGTIKSVEIINFMCHEHLKVDFQPNITFITGPNGSGKSAILTALQVAFGIRANSTGRANKFDQLIKKGCTGCAKIIVEIRNVGILAYKPEDYGNVVIVERTIRTNSNAIRLLSEKRVVISDRKKDVLDMLKHFNIKIDNPLVFMEQTTMKQFIQGDEKVKYDVLMQAMNFKSLEQSFIITQGNLETMNETLKKYKDVELGRKREARDRAREEMDAVQHLESRQQQVVDMQKRVAWADVQSYEREIARLVAENNQMQQSIDAISQSIEKDSEELHNLDDASGLLQQQLAGIENDLKLQVEEADSVEAEMKNVSDPRDDAECLLNTKTRERSQLLRSIDSNRMRVSALTRDMEKQANDTSKQQLEKLRYQLQQNDERLAHIHEELSKKEQENRGDQEKKGEIDSHRQEMMGQVRDVTNELQSLKVKETDMMRSSTDSIQKYGEKTVKLMRDMRGIRFGSEVYCPIGSYVTVKEEFKEWAPAVEMYLDRVLFGAVTNLNTQQDAQTMRSLGKKAGIWSFNVIQVSYEGELMMDSDKLPSRNLLTMLDVLEFKNTIVRKAIIMQSGPERRVLCRDRSEADRLMKKEGKYVLPNQCNAVFLLNGDSIRAKRGLPSYVSTRRQGNGLLQSNMESYLAGLRQLIQNKQNERDDLQASLNQVTNIVNQLNHQCDKRRREIEGLSKSEYAAKRDGMKLKDALDAIAREDEEGELASMRQRQQEAEQEIKGLEEKVRQADAAIDMLTSQIQSMEQQIIPLNMRRESLQARIREIQQKVRRVKEKQDVAAMKVKLETHQQMSQKELQLLQQEKTKYDEVIAKKQDEVAKSVAELGEQNRVMERLNKHACEVELMKYAEDLSHELKKLGVQDLESMNRAYQQKRESYDKSNQEYKSIQKEGQEMERLDKRQKLSYSELRNEAQQSICKRFTKFLSQRKAEGKVDINHNTKEVSLSVKMDSLNEVASSQVSNIRVLSGGEKSFVTLSLIMATAHIIESPFFIMDEFDVFMDEANRVVSLHTIIETARQENKQFIFITPHNLETVVKEMNKDKDNTDISIYQLEDHQFGRDS